MRVLLAIAILFLSAHSYAQHGIVKGTVMGGDGKRVAFASVALFTVADTSLVAGVVTDETGRFLMSHISANRYLLKISFIGYHDLIRDIVLTGANDTIDTTFSLVKDENALLQEVVVSGRKARIQQEGNKLTVDLSRTATTAGVSALEMLKRLPGISTNQDGQLTMRGAAGLNVIIDGKPTYLPPAQLANLLSGMSADNLAKIELLATPPAETDANGNAGAIILTTRKDKSVGYALNFTSGLGSSYQHTLFSHNISGNYQADKINIFAMLDVSAKHRHTLSDAQNNIVYNGEPMHYIRTSDRPIKTIFYTYKLGADWTINEQSSLSFSYDGYLDDWKLKAVSNAQMLSMDHVPRYFSRSAITTEEPYYYNTLHGRYAYKIDSAGKTISLDADYIAFRNNSDGVVSNSITEAADGHILQATQFKYSQPVHIDIFSAKADAELPFKPVSVKAGLKYVHAKVHNPVSYWNFDSAQYQPDTGLTDDYHYSEQVTAAYASVQKQWPATTVSAGLRLEHTQVAQHNKAMDSSWQYTNLFPTLSIGQSLGAAHKLDFTVSRRINRPTYTNLSPTRWFYDVNFYTSGNPRLQPELSWNTTLTYSLHHKYIFQVGYARKENFISNGKILDNTGAVISRDDNYPYANRWDMSIMLPWRVARYWEVNIITGGAYTQLPVSLLSGSSALFARWSGNVVINQQIDLPWDISLELVTRYNTGELQGIARTLPVFSFDGGLRKTFMNKRLTANISFSDLFFTDRTRLEPVSDQVFYYRLRSRGDTRRVFFTVKYQLGGSIKKTTEHSSEEKGRL